MLKPIAVVAVTLFLGVTSLAGNTPNTENASPKISPHEFQIMTPAEAAEHRARMAELTGEARERYRNAQYKKLRERARAQGYELPETPPWRRTKPLPSTVGATSEHQQKAADNSQLPNVSDEGQNIPEPSPAPGKATMPSPTPSGQQDIAPNRKTRLADQPRAPANPVVGGPRTPQPRETDDPRQTRSNNAQPTPGIAISGPRKQAATSTGRSDLFSPLRRSPNGEDYRRAMRDRIDQAIEAFGETQGYTPNPGEQYPGYAFPAPPEPPRQRRPWHLCF